MAKRLPASSGTISSAARAPCSFCVLTIRFVAAWATVGPFAIRSRELAGLDLEGLGLPDPVDDAPLAHRLRVVERAGHDELLGPVRAGLLGQALRAAHRGREADDDLDEAELGAVGGDDEVAGQRELEAPRQRQRRGRRRSRGTGRSSTPWISSNPRRQTAAPSSVERPWNMLTSTPPVHTLPSARIEQRARGVAADLVDRLDRRRRRRPGEEVQRRLVDREDGERPVLLEAPGAELAHAPYASAACLISSSSPGFGVHGSSSGSLS